MGATESSEDDGYSASDDGGFWGDGDNAGDEGGGEGWFGGSAKKKPNTLDNTLNSMQQGLTRAGQSIGVVEKPRTIEDEVCESCPKLTYVLLRASNYFDSGFHRSN
jgi:hypothetical protein